MKFFIYVFFVCFILLFSILTDNKMSLTAILNTHFGKFLQRANLLKKYNLLLVNLILNIALEKHLSRVLQ